MPMLTIKFSRRSDGDAEAAALIKHGEVDSGRHAKQKTVFVVGLSGRLR